MRQRTWTEEQLIEAVKSSYSTAQALRKMGLTIYGASYEQFKKYIKEYNLDISHFKGQGWSKNRKVTCKPSQSLEELLVENSPTNDTYRLKNRLMEAGLLKEICAGCGIGPVWNNKPLKLQMDHKNGVRSDNRLENLRLLCANCHSQTDTFCAKNKTRKQKSVAERVKVANPPIFRNCLYCTSEFKVTDRKDKKFCSSNCSNQYNKVNLSKVPNRPKNQELLELIAKNGMTRTGKMFGVSHTTVRRWVWQDEIKEAHPRNCTG